MPRAHALPVESTGETRQTSHGQQTASAKWQNLSTEAQEGLARTFLGTGSSESSRGSQNANASSKACPQAKHLATTPFNTNPCKAFIWNPHLARPRCPISFLYGRWQQVHETSSSLRIQKIHWNCQLSNRFQVTTSFELSWLAI